MRPSVIKHFHARIAAIPAEEIARQHRMLEQSLALRNIMLGVSYAIGAFFAPPYIAALLAVADFAAETLGLRWMKGLKPAKAPRRYLGTLAMVYLSQTAFAIMLALCFGSNLPLTEAYAAGALSLSLLQLASIRVIHKPYAVVGLATSFAVAVIALMLEEQNRSGAAGLLLGLIALTVAAYFVAAIIHANHALHADMARERTTARAADQAKSRFLAQMSHELRTPLNAILGLGHAEMMQVRDPASMERLRLVTEAARGLAVILDDILDMSAIEAGHLQIRPVPCDPAREIAAAAELYHPLFEAQGLLIGLVLSSNLPSRAVLDPQRLRQCLTNLFSNALKYTRWGGVAVQADLNADGQIAITFSDTGPGIPASEAERIFKPFQRGPNAQPGTGLGLSITRALARSMGGDMVLLPSTEGARFLLTLGFTTETCPQIPADRPREVPPVPDAAKAARVLIVDDIATNRLVARAHLRLLGVATEEAASGQEALDKIRQAPPDLVLLDMNMPGMDGLDTLRLIRKLPSRAARLPVVAMTADATDAHRRRYLEAGLDGYLAKPLTSEAVSEIVARFAPRV